MKKNAKEKGLKGFIKKNPFLSGVIGFLLLFLFARAINPSNQEIDNVNQIYPEEQSLSNQLPESIKQSKVFSHLTSEGRENEFNLTFMNSSFFQEVLELSLLLKEICGEISPDDVLMYFDEGMLLLIDANTYEVKCDYLNLEKENEKELISSSEEITDSEDLFKVTRVIDGDTIEISSGEKVRLICIDSPERGEDYYSEASKYLKDLILNKEVELVKDISERDRYGRLLRYLYLEEDFVNELIVYHGYGKAYPYSPDTSKCSIIQEAEQHAKNNNLGIWAEKEEQEITEETFSNSDVVCSSDYYNCGDFSSCSEVMEVFNTCSSDIHRLDGDNDGIPCESLC